MVGLALHGLSRSDVTNVPSLAFVFRQALGRRAGEFFHLFGRHFGCHAYDSLADSRGKITLFDFSAFVREDHFHYTVLGLTFCWHLF